MLTRLLLVRAEPSVILEELHWDNLPASYWKQIESIVELLKPFAQYMQLTSSDKIISISMVILVIIKLHLHLEQMGSVYRLCQIANTMHRVVI